MKLKLISPPSPFLLDERVFPYLGLVSMGTKLKQKGHDVEIVDLTGVSNWEEIVRNLPNTDIFGITSTSSQYRYAHQIGKLLRGKGHRIIGGTHVNNLPLDDTLNLEDLLEFDTIIYGEGEKLNPNSIGKSRFIDLGVVKTLDDLPIPDRSLIDIQSYVYRLNGRKATTILTQRGCPFNCVFCSGRNNEMYRKSRQHSPERVVAEMDYLHKNFGFDAFMWFDDELNVNPARLEEIANRLKGRNYIHRGFLRSDLLLRHPETLDYLKRMGFVELCIGVESGSDRVLKVIKKHTTTAMNIEAANMIKSSGMRLKTFTIIGLPSETYDDVNATKEYLLRVKPDGFDIAMMQPYPGSEVYNQSTPSNKYPDYKFEYNGLYFNRPRFSESSLFHKGIPGTYKCHVRTDELTSDEIIRLRDKLETDISRELK